MVKPLHTHWSDNRIYWFPVSVMPFGWCRFVYPFCIDSVGFDFIFITQCGFNHRKLYYFSVFNIIVKTVYSNSLRIVYDLGWYNAFWREVFDFRFYTFFRFTHVQVLSFEQLKIYFRTKKLINSIVGGLVRN